MLMHMPLVQMSGLSRHSFMSDTHRAHGGGGLSHFVTFCAI